MLNTIFIILIVLVISAGQVLLKHVSSSIDFSSIRGLFSFPLAAAIVIYGLAFFMWLFALQRTPLGKAFSLYGLSFIFVPLLAFLILREPLEQRTLLGGAIILAGIAVANWGSGS
jgi:drug/metabolite transporter (DMT)-like permease